MLQPARRTVYAMLVLPVLLVLSTLAGLPARAQDQPSPIADDPTIHAGHGAAADGPETRFVVKDPAAAPVKGELPTLAVSRDVMAAFMYRFSAYTSRS
ncbi:hypothetical protein ACIQC0_04165 [Pseudarthrobacter sp. NPDC092419]|uniref:hypothetical protein n=1 Tax=Pseudarthrobacter sp. NPDC092419 TaxID=3364414 RepID=UPI0037FEB6AC